MSSEIALCHGSWQDEDLYLLRKEDIVHVFDRMEASLLFFGHTHRAGLYAQWDANVGELICEPGVAAELPRRGRYLVNPGSVGQPRDRDVRAAYAMFDTDSWSLTFSRVPYDVEKAQLRILAAGLPEVHAFRLAEGR